MTLRSFFLETHSTWLINFTLTSGPFKRGQQAIATNDNEEARKVYEELIKPGSDEYCEDLLLLTKREIDRCAT